MDKNNGGAAFPRVTLSEKENEIGDLRHIGNEGMSLRDWFAGKAMQAFITARASIYEGGPEQFDDDLSRWSYETADAMLRAREQ